MKYVILIGCFIYVVIRTVLFYIRKAAQNSIINKIKKDPSKALGYIHNLDMPYKRVENFELKVFELLTEAITKARYVDNFHILHSVSLSPTQFLVFTELAYTDFDVNAFGKPSDQKVKTYHDFLFQYEAEKKDLHIYSSLYSNATDKFQKQEFIKSVLRVQQIND